MPKFGSFTTLMCERANITDPASLKNALKKQKPKAIWSIWEPYEVQKQLLACEADLVAYGGSAGGSKSTGIIMAAYLQHQRSLILRKTFPNLKELIERSREMFAGSGGRYNSNLKSWRWPDGKIIEFGTVSHLSKREDHKGREKSALLVDEVTELPGGWDTLQYLMGWVRSPIPDQKCQTIITFNPPRRPEEEWIKDVFAPWINVEYTGKVAESGEIRWFANIDGVDVEVESGESFYHEDELIEPQSRTFIRATLEDTAALQDSGYRQRLKALPEPLRSQLLYGDMNIESEDDPWQAIPSQWVEDAFQLWIKHKDDDVERIMTAMGADVARGGKDQTILSRLWDDWFFDWPLEYPGPSTPDGKLVATQIYKHCEDNARVNIDVVGIGSSPYDFARDLVDAYPIGAGEKSEKFDHTGQLAFKDKRSELVWMMREALDPNIPGRIALPRHSRLKADLCSYRWTVEPPTERQQTLWKKRYQDKKSPYDKLKGQIRVLSKDEIKKLIGRSPDHGDAYCLALDKPKMADVFRPGQTATIKTKKKPSNNNFGR